MAESIRFFEGDSVTCTASVVLTGARFVTVVGEPTGTGIGEVAGNPLVGLPLAAGGIVYGVTATDAASGDQVGVYVAPGQHVWVETGTGGVSAGTSIQTDANGKAIALTTGSPVGFCVIGAAAGAQALVEIRKAAAGTGTGVDSLVVHLAGAETITGTKTITSPLTHTGAAVGLNGNAPVAKAAAITSPTAPSAGYVQAEAASAKTAIDAIRVALQAIGITA